MKFSLFTTNVLKNFKAINPGLKFTPGNKIETINLQNTVIAEAITDDLFPTEFCIYNLNEFLSVISFFKDYDIVFYDNYLKVVSDKQEFTYNYSNPAVIVSPEKSIKFPEADVHLRLSANQLEKVIKAAGSLKSDTLYFNTAGVLISSGTNSNSYLMNLSNDEDYTFTIKDAIASINIERLKIITTYDYDIDISIKGITRFKAITDDETSLTYYIANNIA